MRHLASKCDQEKTGMYDFKTFAQANVDLIFKDFDRLPQPGEEVFARQFTL